MAATKSITTLYCALLLEGLIQHLHRCAKVKTMSNVMLVATCLWSSMVLGRGSLLHEGDIVLYG